MGDISANFSRSEFACKCGCGFDTVDSALIDILQELRAYFNKSVTINSGCRCYQHNQNEGGSSSSQHLYGRAADIVVTGVEPKAVADFIEANFGSSCSIGRYVDFTHVDTRSGHCARWGNN